MQLIDFCVMHIFFLITQEVKGNIIESIAGEFVLSMHMNE